MKNLLLLLLVTAVVLCGTATAGAVNVVDDVNRVRMRKGYYPLLPLSSLQMAAEAGAWKQARLGRTGHHGTKPKGTSEGAGSGRAAPNFRFSTCYHTKGWYTTEHRYAGAAVHKGYATIVLDKDKDHGAIGSSRGKGRGRIVRRLFRWRR